MSASAAAQRPTPTSASGIRRGSGSDNSDDDDSLQVRSGGSPRARNHASDPSTSPDRTTLAARDTERCPPCCSITQGAIRKKAQKLEDALKQLKTLNIGRIITAVGLTALNTVGVIYLLTLSNLAQTQCAIDNNCDDGKCDLSETLKRSQITLGIEFGLALFYMGWQFLSFSMGRDKEPGDERNKPIKFLRDYIITLPMAVINGLVATLPNNLKANNCTEEYDQVKAYDFLMPALATLSAIGLITIVAHSLAKNQGIVPTPAPQPEAEALLDEEESA